MVHKFYNGKVILGNTLAYGVNVYTKDDRIIAVTSDELPHDAAHDAKGGYISPGFIDIHVHGGGEYYFSDGTVEAMTRAAEIHAQHGTTTLLPTVSTAPTSEYVKMLEIFDEASRKNTKGAYMPGIHIEGPYFSSAQTGGQAGIFLRNPDPAEYEMLLSRYGDKIIRWSSAPELPGTKEFVRALREYNVVPSIGHSDAEYDCVLEAFDMGYTLITHLYSCTSTVHRKNAYRYAGIIEAAYMLDGMDVEIIADGKHLPPSLLKFVYKFKGVDRISLITDAIRGAGFPDGSVIKDDIGSDDRNFIIEDGVAKLPDRSAFAGSVSFTNRLVRNMMNLADVPLLEAVRMATANPARMAKLPDRGVIREGAYADLLIFNDNIDIALTMVNGNVVFEEK